MMKFRKIVLIGVGLIGGSIGLAVKKHKLAGEVVGIARHKSSLLKALKLKAIDRASLDLDVCRDADMVIFCTPVETIRELAPKIAGLVKPDCLVSDVGSTKEEIVKALASRFPGFVGAHPLAGSEKRGVGSARVDLFNGSLCILTPAKAVASKNLIRLKDFWHKLGAHTEIMSPKRHDEIVARVSHLPHIAAFSLMASLPSNLLRYGATGLKDTTRIAASDAELWTEIFLSNKHLLGSIRSFESSLGELKRALLKKDRQQLKRFLTGAQKKRVKLS